MERGWAAFWEHFGRHVAVFRGLKKALKKVNVQKPTGSGRQMVDKWSRNGRQRVNGRTWISEAQPGEELRRGKPLLRGKPKEKLKIG